MSSQAARTTWKWTSKGCIIYTEGSAKFETDLLILNQCNIYGRAQKIMGQNLSQCKSEQHLTQVRTQFWLLAFKTLFFFSSVAPDSHIWAKNAKTMERDRDLFPSPGLQGEWPKVRRKFERSYPGRVWEHVKQLKKENSKSSQYIRSGNLPFVNSAIPTEFRGGELSAAPPDSPLLVGPKCSV